TSQRHNVDETCTSDNSSSATDRGCDPHEKCDLSNNDGHCDGVTLAKPPLREKEGISARRCAHCDQSGNLLECHYGDVSPCLHRGCIDGWRAAFVGDIPPFLDRRGELQGAAGEKIS